MITALKFVNFRILRNATLPLGPVTVLLGPNGSGKSTVLAGLEALRAPGNFPFERLASIVPTNVPATQVEVRAYSGEGAYTGAVWLPGQGPRWTGIGRDAATDVGRFSNIRTFAFDPDMVSTPVPLDNNISPDRNGHGVARTLTNLQDKYPERFDALNSDLRRWLPEYDRVLLDTPVPGHRTFMLRTTVGKHPIAALDLSQGTLLAVALLSIAHLPDPPPVIGLEEPDRGIHPRLLRDVQDAIYRLAHPEDYGDDRAPVQVILTTHSPYMVDLFRDHPEEIVIVKKQGLSAEFESLSTQPNIDEILRDTHLGEAWYSGILGGVPAGT